MVILEAKPASQVRPIAAVIRCQLGLIIKTKTIDFEHTEPWETRGSLFPNNSALKTRKNT